MHDRRLAARAGELKPSAVRELLKHSKLPGVISLGGGIPAPELFDTEAGAGGAEGDERAF